MGWWQETETAVIGDPVADYMEGLKTAVGGKIPWTEVSEIPAEVTERITALYVEGLGRKPTQDDLKALLDYSR